MTSDILLADCHTHLDQYPSAEMTEILERAGDSSVVFAVCAGTTLQSTQDCIDLAERHEPLFAGVGIHPMEARDPVTGVVLKPTSCPASSRSGLILSAEKIETNWLGKLTAPGLPKFPVSRNSRMQW